MINNTTKREIKIIGIDLAKTTFHLHCVDGNGLKIMTKKLNLCGSYSPPLAAHITNGC